MIKIIGVGDIMPGGMLAGIDNGFVSDEVLDLLKTADIRVGTLETAVGNEPNWYEGKMQRLGDVIYTKDDDVNKLTKLNIDIVSLANNHVFDLGPEGIKHTIEVLDKIGVKHCGAGMNIEEASRPVVVNINGKTIAFVAFCDWRPETTGWCLMASDTTAGVNPLYDDYVKEQLIKLKSEYDYVVAIPHWGKEHTYWPTNNVYKLSDKMIGWGADVILGGHTHRIQPVVKRKKKCIVYSLGNFLFADRIIVHPRSTWYPSEKNTINYKSIPRTFGYPYVEEPTLKCSPEKNRVGQIVEVSIGDKEITFHTTCTKMSEDCHISLYEKKNPTRKIKCIINLGIYPFANWFRNVSVKGLFLARRIASNIIHLRFLRRLGGKIVKNFAKSKIGIVILSKLLSRSFLENLSFNKFVDLLKVYSPSSLQFPTELQKQIYYDSARCKILYGIQPKDYLAYGWLNRSELSRMNYITTRINSQMYHKYDNAQLCPIMADKARFNKVYEKFVTRDWMYISSITEYNDFVDFCNKHEEIVIKPKDGERGKGVRLVDVSEPELIDSAWKECRENHCIIEEVIKQGELSKLHKESVNTVRISTAVDEDGIPHILASSIRCGRGDNFVDNAHAGGLFCGIDVHSGIILSQGIDKTNAHYMFHPDTGVQFLGMQIPKWEELKSIAIEAASLVPGLRYIGWDWVLCADGHWELLEGNEPGNPDVLQLGRGCGLLMEYKKYLK